MTTYILFIFGSFEDHEDVEFFCLEIFNNSDLIDSVKYVIENGKNIIVIFESDKDKEKLSNEVKKLLDNDNVTFYFLFERNSIITSHLPGELSKFAYKPLDENTLVKVKQPIKNLKLNLNDVLDKIQKYGIDNLTKEERKFLDDFVD
jgi:hypothetical protein